MNFLHTVFHEDNVFCWFGAAAIVKYASLLYLEKRHVLLRPVRVGKVSGLRLFPGKSMKHIQTDHLDVGISGASNGPIEDRHLMLTYEDYSFITARNEPTVCLIQPSFDDSYFYFTAANMPKLKIPIAAPTDAKAVDTKVHGQPVLGVDRGDEASAWFSSFLNKPGIRLLQSPPSLAKRRINNGPTVHHKKAQDKDVIAFQDMCSMSLIGEATIKDADGKLPIDIDERRFRMNILADETEPYDEDGWHYIHIGPVIMKRIKTTDRCLLTTVDPETGIKDPQEHPLKGLRSFRTLPGFRNPCLGLSCVVETPGTIRMGDSIYVVYD